MNAKIDLNLIIQLCGYVIVAAVLIISTRDSLNMLSERLAKHDCAIQDLYEKNTAMTGRVSTIEGKIEVK